MSLVKCGSFVVGNRLMLKKYAFFVPWVLLFLEWLSYWNNNFVKDYSLLFPPSLFSNILEVMEKIETLNGYRRQRTHTKGSNAQMILVLTLNPMYAFFPLNFSE
jgi:hypothetical protein